MTSEAIRHLSADRRDLWHDQDKACAELRRLDANYATNPRSPIHHNNRCPIHKGW